MRTDIPSSIYDTRHQLEPEGLAVLFKLWMTNGTEIFMSPKNEVIWRGDTYESIPCQMTEVEHTADGKLNRPKFSVANPDGLFTSQIYAGVLDNAILTRIRILKGDLDANRDFAIREQLRVAKVLNLSKDLLMLELRDVFDGHQVQIPARAYYPPEFPHVRLR